MTTKLEGPLKREIAIDGNAYTLTITPAGMTIVAKGRRKGFELRWPRLGERRSSTGDGSQRIANGKLGV